MNTQHIEDILIVLKSKLSEEINKGLKTKSQDKVFKDKLKKQGYLNVAIRNLQELNSYGVELIE
jgi:hypothetical protein